MSRNFFPAALAIGMGIFTGYYTFQPSLQELQSEREQSHPPTSSQQPSGQAGASNTVSSTQKESNSGTQSGTGDSQRGVQQ